MKANISLLVVVVVTNCWLGFGAVNDDGSSTNSSAACGIDARMLRYPDVSATQIVFSYAGDIWVAPKSGGLAQRLSSPKGEEIFPPAG